MPKGGFVTETPGESKRSNKAFSPAANYFIRGDATE